MNLVKPQFIICVANSTRCSQRASHCHFDMCLSASSSLKELVSSSTFLFFEFGVSLFYSLQKDKHRLLL